MQIKFDLREPRRELAERLRALRRARALVVSDPEIMGGDPVFHGTRVPVHLIAMLAEKESAEDFLKGYPRLTAEMVRLAGVYAQAYALRDGLRRQPWHGSAPVRRVCVPLSRLRKILSSCLMNAWWQSRTEPLRS